VREVGLEPTILPKGTCRKTMPTRYSLIKILQVLQVEYRFSNFP